MIRVIIDFKLGNSWFLINSKLHSLQLDACNRWEVSDHNDIKSTMLADPSWNTLKLPYKTHIMMSKLSSQNQSNHI